MRWLRARKTEAKHAPPSQSPLVVAVTTALTRETALELRRQVDLVNSAVDVVIDLTAIPSFDSEGADALLEMQAAHADGHVSIVGFRQATSRLIGPDVPTPPVSGPLPATAGDWVIRRLRNLVVVQPGNDDVPTAAGLAESVALAAQDVAAAIIVIDLRAVPDLPVSVVEAVAFASSTAALRGQELLVVNVAAGPAEALRAAGLSATTFVAPEPLVG